MAWHQRLYEHQVQRDSQMQQAFQDMAAGRCPQFPPAQCPPAQLVLMSFEEFVAQNAGPSPVISSPIYSPKHVMPFNTVIYPVNMSFQHPGNKWIYRWRWSSQHSGDTEPDHSDPRRWRRSWR